MFERPTASKPNTKTLSQLQEELADLNDTIELQKDSIKHGGGFIGLEMAKATLESYETQKKELEDEIERHPESNLSTMKISQ